MIDLLPDPDTISAISARIFDVTKRQSFWSALTTLTIAAIIFYRYFGRRSSFRRYLHFLFPRQIWLHSSALTDVKVAFAAGFTTWISKALLGITISAFAIILSGSITATFGPFSSQFSSHPLSLILLGLIAFLLQDFALYLTHYIGHKWPPFWAFHRLHHSAEVLTPITAKRNHPLYNLVERTMQVLLVAPMQAMMLIFWQDGIADQVVLVTNIGYGLFALAGSNLRHSHIWLSFGPLEYIFISPAQHQLHHSKAPEHWDKNFGVVFAIWDWMFGTLVLAERKRQRIKLGLAGEDKQPHPGLVDAMLEPFSYCKNAISQSRGAKWIGKAQGPRKVTLGDIAKVD